MKIGIMHYLVCCSVQFKVCLISLLATYFLTRIIDRFPFLIHSTGLYLI